MEEFIKTFGRGMLYVIISPLVLIYLGLHLLYAIGCYLGYEVAGILLFFTGKNFKAEDRESLELKKRKEESIARAKAVQPTPYTVYPYPGVNPTAAPQPKEEIHQ